MHRHADTDTESLTPWVKSTYSTANCTCVEVRFLPTIVQLRDSKQISAMTGENVSDIITVPAEEWCQFLRGVADNNEDETTDGSLRRTRANDGSVVLHCTTSGTALSYHNDEWEAFYAGVIDGEFDPPAQADPS